MVKVGRRKLWMKPTDRQTLQSLYEWIDLQRAKVTAARNREPRKTLRHVMLAGKVKAYVDVMCYVRDHMEKTK